MENNEGLRSFSGPTNSWNTETEWPKGIWRFGDEYLVVKAKTKSKVFHVYLYRISKANIVVKLKIKNEDKTASICYQGDVPHISEYTDCSTGPHFNCDIRQLLNFIKPLEGDLDTHKLTVKVRKIVETEQKCEEL